MKMNDQYNQCYSLFLLLVLVERLRLPLFNFSILVPLFHYVALILDALMRWWDMTHSSLCLILLICSIFKWVSALAGASVEQEHSWKEFPFHLSLSPLGPWIIFLSAFCHLGCSPVVCNWNTVFKWTSLLCFYGRTSSSGKYSAVELKQELF